MQSREPREFTVTTTYFNEPLLDDEYRTIAEAVNGICTSNGKIGGDSADDECNTIEINGKQQTSCTNANTRFKSVAKITHKKADTSSEKTYTFVFLHEKNKKYGNYLSAELCPNIPKGAYLLEHFDHSEPGHERATFYMRNGTYKYLGIYRYVAKFKLDVMKDGKTQEETYTLWQRMREHFEN